MTATTPIHAPAWDHPRGPAAARILLEVGASHGLTAAQCLAGIQLSVENLEDPATVLQAGDELSIARNLIHILGDRPGLGSEAGAKYTIGILGIWGYAMMSSPTVGELIRLGVAYAGLSFAFIDSFIESSPTETLVVFNDTDIPDDVRAFFVERELAKLATLLPLATGLHHGVRFETQFDDTRAIELRKLLPRVEIRTGERRHLIAFDQAIVSAPLPDADPTTAQLLEEQCARLLDRGRRRDGVGGHLRTLILAQIDSAPTMDAIAAQLHMKQRTLRRHLEAEGTKFSELIDEVRATLADELLATGELTLANVAARLGYHDAAGFSRAYRRWTGRTPGESRPRSTDVGP